MLNKTRTLAGCLLLLLLCFPSLAQIEQPIDAQPVKNPPVQKPPQTQAANIIITATTNSHRVRCVAIGEVNQTRLQVFSSDGSPLFDSDYHLGNLVNWQLADQQGQMLTDGSYLFLVTVKDFSGTLTQKYGTAQIAQGEVSLQQIGRDELPSGQALALDSNKLSTVLSPIDRVGVSASTNDATTLDTTGGQNQTKKSANGTNIAGTGTQNQVAKWTDNNGTLGNSAITELNGNVGIGISNPTALLHIQGSTETVRQSLSDPSSFIQFAFFEGGVKKGAFGYQGSTSAGLVGGPSAMVFGTLTNSPVAFFTNGIERVRLDANGNFGIGTPAPLAKLDVRGDVFVGLTARADNTTTPGNNIYVADDGGGDPRNSYRIDSYFNNFYFVARSGNASAAGAGIVFRTAPAGGGEGDRMTIDQNGNVGIGTTPSAMLHVVGVQPATVSGTGTNAAPVLQIIGGKGGNTSNTNTGVGGTFAGIGGAVVIQGGAGGDGSYGGSGGSITLQPGVATGISCVPNCNGRILLAPSSGFLVGIGTGDPDATLTVNGGADKPGGGSWNTFSDERLKTIRGRFTTGLKAVMQLQPLRYEYRRDNALGIQSDGEHVGFGAQAVRKIIPEAVTKNDKGYLLVNNDPILWTMLNAIKEQQAEINKQQQELKQLRDEVRRSQIASRRRRQRGRR